MAGARRQEAVRDRGSGHQRKSGARAALPNCREPLRSNLHQEQVIPEGGTAVAVTYCGACGWTLACAPASTRGPMQFQPVAAPADERTPEGQFQLRCRELIGEIRSLGFEPNVWVAMINDLGAAAAARKLLADHHQLAVTPWLVRRGRPELTLEHEIGQRGWAGLFTDAERDEAARRLARGRTPRERCPGGTGSAHCAGARYGGVGGERHLDQGQRRDRPAACRPAFFLFRSMRAVLGDRLIEVAFGGHR